MTDAPNGAHVDEDTVHRYVAGSLSREEASAFEVHFMDCAVCRDAVIAGTAIRAGIRALPAAAVSTEVRSRRPVVRRFVVAVPLIAAAFALYLLVPRRDLTSELGRVAAAPAFEPLAVRSATNENDRKVDSAMVLYRGGHLEASRTMLREVANAQPTPAVLFYLGVASLSVGDAGAAIEPLRRAAEPGSPYLHDAHFYLGKAWLQRGQPDSAIAHLSAVSPGPRYPAARALLDSVRSVQRR